MRIALALRVFVSMTDPWQQFSTWKMMHTVTIFAAFSIEHLIFYNLVGHVAMVYVTWADIHVFAMLFRHISKQIILQVEFGLAILLANWRDVNKERAKIDYVPFIIMLQPSVNTFDLVELSKQEIVNLKQNTSKSWMFWSNGSALNRYYCAHSFSNTQRRNAQGCNECFMVICQTVSTENVQYFQALFAIAIAKWNIHLEPSTFCHPDAKPIDYVKLNQTKIDEHDTKLCIRNEASRPNEIENYLMKIARQSIDNALHAKKNQTTAVLFGFFYKDTSTKREPHVTASKKKNHL